MRVDCFYCDGSGVNQHNGSGLCHHCEGSGALEAQPPGKYHPVAYAYRFATDAHEGQVDDLGEPYVEAHPRQVFEILRVIAPDDIELHCAAWLHDVLEDTEVGYKELIAEFGADVADLVHEVTHEGRKDSKGYYFPRLRTPKGIQLKFADRLSNLSRMEGAWKEDRITHYLRQSRFWRTGQESRFKK